MVMKANRSSLVKTAATALGAGPVNVKRVKYKLTSWPKTMHCCLVGIGFMDPQIHVEDPHLRTTSLEQYISTL